MTSKDGIHPAHAIYSESINLAILFKYLNLSIFPCLLCYNYCFGSPVLFSKNAC